MIFEKLSEKTKGTDAKESGRFGFFLVTPMSWFGLLIPN